METITVQIPAEPGITVSPEILEEKGPEPAKPEARKRDKRLGGLLPPRASVVFLTTGIEAVEHRVPTRRGKVTRPVPLITTTPIDITRYPPAKLREIRARKINFLGELQR